MPVSIGRKDSNQILREMSQDLVDSSPLADISSISTLGGILQAAANKYAEVYDDIDANFSAQYTRTAEGVYLDAKAEELGIAREVSFLTSISCEDNVFYIRTKDGSTIFSNLATSAVPEPPFRIIGRGVAITSTSNPGLELTTNETSYILPEDRLTFLGVSGNLGSTENFVEGTFNIFPFAGVPTFQGANLDNLELVQSQTVFGINSVESDESLRERVRQDNVITQGSNTTSLVVPIESNLEIASVIVERFIRGTGSADILLVPVAYRISQATIDQVQRIVDSTKSFGENVLVASVVLVPVHMTITVNAVGVGSNTSSIVPQIENGFAKLTTGDILSHEIIKSMVVSSNVDIEVTRLVIDTQEVLPKTNFRILVNELFKLKSPIREGNLLDSPINVIGLST